MKYNINNGLLFYRHYEDFDQDVLQSLFGQYDIEYKKFINKKSNFLYSCNQYFLTILRESYYLFNLIRFYKFFFKSKKLSLSKNTVLFQLSSSMPKHVENVEHFANAFKKSEYSPLVLCWGAYNRFNFGSLKFYFKKKDIDAINLENFFKIKHITKTISIKNKIKKHLFNFKEDLEEKIKIKSYDNILSDIIFRSFEKYLKNEFSQHCRYEQSLIEMQTLLKSIVAYKLWDGVSGRLLNEQINKFGKPFRFHFQVSSAFPSPYRNLEFEKDIDLYFTGGVEHKKIVETESHLSPDKVKIVGQLRFRSCYNYKKKFSTLDSKKSLYLDKYKFVIGYEAGSVLNGFMNLNEQIDVLKTLLDFVDQNKTICLVIKTPPSYPTHPAFYEVLNKYNSKKNIINLKSNFYPLRFINASDLIITKNSTIGHEAIHMNKPIIACLLDKEEGFKFYENAAQYIYDIIDLRNLLETFKEKNLFLNWKDKQLKRHLDYFKTNPMIEEKQQQEQTLRYFSQSIKL